nr:1490_t:CDS:2 [Entrophospora candida]
MLEIKTSDGNSLIFLDPEEPHELYLDADEWELISQLVKILYPYEVATKVVCASNYCTADLVYPTIYELIKKSHEILNMIQNPEAEKVGKIILKDSEMRWSSPNNALVFASFFDLRFKNLSSYQKNLKSYMKK